jgi:hypothetical protein
MLLYRQRGLAAPWYEAIGTSHLTRQVIAPAVPESAWSEQVFGRLGTSLRNAVQKLSQTNRNTSLPKYYVAYCATDGVPGEPRLTRWLKSVATALMAIPMRRGAGQHCAHGDPSGLAATGKRSHYDDLLIRAAYCRPRVSGYRHVPWFPADLNYTCAVVAGLVPATTNFERSAAAMCGGAALYQSGWPGQARP